MLDLFYILSVYDCVHDFNLLTSNFVWLLVQSHSCHVSHFSWYLFICIFFWFFSHVRLKKFLPKTFETSKVWSIPFTDNGCGVDFTDLILLISLPIVFKRYHYWFNVSFPYSTFPSSLTLFISLQSAVARTWICLGPKTLFSRLFGLCKIFHRSTEWKPHGYI